MCCQALAKLQEKRRVVMRKVDAEAKWMRRLENIGSMVEMLDSEQGCKALAGSVLVEVKVLCDQERRGDVLVIVTARVGDEKYVGFCGGPDIGTALLTWRKKEGGEGLSFRKHVPYGERVANGKGII